MLSGRHDIVAVDDVQDVRALGRSSFRVSSARGDKSYSVHGPRSTSAGKRRRYIMVSRYDRNKDTL